MRSLEAIERVSAKNPFCNTYRYRYRCYQTDPKSDGRKDSKSLSLTTEPISMVVSILIYYYILMYLYYYNLFVTIRRCIYIIII